MAGADSNIAEQHVTKIQFRHESDNLTAIVFQVLQKSE
jgi:hypothetical protein